MKLPFPRSVKSWLAVSLTAVALVSISPMMRSRAQSPPPTYTIIDLGTFGGAEAKAFAINSCGQVAGYATLAGESKRPFFRPSSSLINLGVLSGEGIATNLNNSGQVVGYSTVGFTSRAFIWHDDNGNNVSDSGEMKDILPIGRTGAAEDVNDNGRVVGWVLSAGSSSGTGGYEGFTWDPNQNPNFQIISGSPAHDSPKVYGINYAVAIVGENSDSRMGFILRNGIFTDIPAFGTGIKSVAYAVSELEHVVGAAALNNLGTPTMHAIIWTDAGLTPGLKDLGTLPGKTHSFAYNVAIVNGSVQVVGSSNNNIDLSDARAFVWQDLNGDGDGVGDPTEMKDLTTLISDPDWTVLQEAYSINSSGQIAGYGLKSNGETHAFLLTPPSGAPTACLPTVSVSVSPSAVSENAVSPMSYTFTRSIVTASPLTVNFSTTGTATADNDYSISAVSSVQIPANMASVTVTVNSIDDSTDEPNETVILTVTPDPVNYTVAASPLNAATGTITDNDATPTIQITDVSLPELNSGSTSTIVFTVSLSNPSSSQITVNYATDSTGATATGGTGCGSGIDFVNTGDGLTFLAGETSKQAGVTLCGDNGVEPNETFFVTLSGNSPNSVLPANLKGTGTITNDDADVIVGVSPTSVTESDSPNLVYTFTRTGATTGALTVNFSVAGTATITDYTQSGAATFSSSAGTVTFAAGSPTATVTVDPTADSTLEPDETLGLTLTTGANYNVGSPTAATGTITNDDTDVSLTLSPSSVTESDSQNLVYTFTRAGVTTGALTVNFSVAGTATFNTDYTQSGAATFSSSAGTVTLPAGNSSATVTLAPTPDFIHEGDETATLTVTAGTGYNVGSPSSQQGTIIEDDDPPTIQITNVTAPEPSSGSTSFVFTVSLTNPSASQIDVNYSTDPTGATATGGASCGGGIDFVNIIATGLSFAPGETSKQVSVTVCSDSSLEPDETFFVNLSGNTNSNLPAGTKGTGTITPQVPVLWTEEAGPSCPSGTCLAAVDSVTFVRGPFKLTNDWNLTPSDRATRIILFTSNLGMTDANLASGILSVHINGAAIPLANIEHVGTVSGVSGMDASYVIVKLPASLPAGSNTMTVNMGSVASNVAILSIVP